MEQNAKYNPAVLFVPVQTFSCQEDQSYKCGIISMVTCKPCLTLQHGKRYIRRKKSVLLLRIAIMTSKVVILTLGN